MVVTCNTATVGPVLDEAFGAAGYWLNEIGREAWKANAAKAAADVQNHPSSRDIEPGEFEVSVDQFSYSVVPVAVAAAERENAAAKLQKVAHILAAPDAKEAR